MSRSRDPTTPRARAWRQIVPPVVPTAADHRGAGRIVRSAQRPCRPQPGWINDRDRKTRHTLGELLNVGRVAVGADSSELNLEACARDDRLLGHPHQRMPVEVLVACHAACPGEEQLAGCSRMGVLAVAGVKAADPYRLRTFDARKDGDLTSAPRRQVGGLSGLLSEGPQRSNQVGRRYQIASNRIAEKPDTRSEYIASTRILQ
jgi:hypothetical protein